MSDVKNQELSMLYLSEEDKILGLKLKEIRIEVGLSQTKLGKIFGVSGQQIAKFETGKNRISAKMLFHMGLLGNKSFSWFTSSLQEKDYKNMRVVQCEPDFIKQVVSYTKHIKNEEMQQHIIDYLTKIYSAHQP